MNEESHPHYAATMEDKRAKERTRLIEECVEVMYQLMPHHGPNTFRRWLEKYPDEELPQVLKSYHKERGYRCALSEWSCKNLKEPS